MNRSLSKTALAIGLCLPGIAFVTGWHYASSRESPSADSSPAPANNTIASGDLEPPSSQPRKRTRWEFQKFAESDPVAAADEIAEMPKHRSADATMASTAHWAASDPVAAMAWIDSLPESDLADNARMLALVVWCNVDSRAAMDFFAGLSADEQLRVVEGRFDQGHLFLTAIGRTNSASYFGSAAGAMMWSTPPEELGPLLDVMLASDDEYVRARAIMKRAQAMFASDPGAALTYAIEHKAADSLLAQVAVTDPRRAFDLAQQHGVSATGVIGAWTKADPEAARAAIGEIAQPVTRAAAIERWLAQMVEIDPAVAARSFVGEREMSPVHDYHREDNRSRLLRKSFEAWFLDAPEDTTRLAATLPDEDRKELATTLERLWKAQGAAAPGARLTELGFAAEGK